MRTAPCLFALVVIPVCTAEEIPVTPHVDSVGLFKNGVAVVRASFEAKQAGVYRWDDLPRPIHGSFWVESEGAVGVRSTTRMVEETDKAETPAGNLQKDLAGKMVTVKLKASAGIPEPELRGRVWMIPDAAPRKAWDTSMPDSDPFALHRTRWDAAAIPAPAPATTGNFLVLEEESGGRRYIELSTLASVTAEGPFGPSRRKVEKPVMIFEVGEVPRGNGRVRISYLTRGITWAPSYRIDLTTPDKLAIRRDAVVRNELMELKDTEVQLISGFPNIEFAHVDSPLWAGGTLAAFFQQLGSPTSVGTGSGGPVSQQTVMYNFIAPAASAPPLPFPEKNEGGDDVHFESIGPRTLAPGDSLSLETGSATASCERVVEWVVPDPRDADGRYLRLTTGKEPEESHAWDAVKFTNPFKLPLTTGPALVTEAGRFRGQSLSRWVNPGQSTCLPITKALSIQTRSAEVEEEDQREQLRIGGRDYQRTKVKGTLTLHNFRGKEATMNVRAEFSGEMLEAGGKPETRLRVEGAGSINPRRELAWTFKLAPGEEKTLTYRYSVLVYR